MILNGCNILTVFVGVTIHTNDIDQTMNAFSLRTVKIQWMSERHACKHIEDMGLVFPVLPIYTCRFPLQSSVELFCWAIHLSMDRPLMCNSR